MDGGNSMTLRQTRYYMLLQLGHSVQEIADICNVPVGSVTSSLHHLKRSPEVDAELVVSALRCHLISRNPAPTRPTRVYASR